MSAKRRYYRTASGVLVYATGSELWRLPNHRIVKKVYAFRADTGGRHGWLRLDRLTPAKPPKKRGAR